MNQSVMVEPVDRAVDMILGLEKKVWATGEGRGEALRLLRRGLCRHPGHPRLLARLTSRTQTLGYWGDGEFDIAAAFADDRQRPAPFCALYLTEDRALHRAAAAAHAARLVAERPATPFRHGAGKAKLKLRIGYLSADFREHAVAHLAAEMFERHDRRRVAATGYSLHKDDGSPLRRRLEAGFDRFVDLAGATDDKAAALIHGDAIDILVEMNGYTAGARWGILARRPAPLQVSFLGFPGTTAADSIDYLIGDRIVLGDDAAAHFTERLVELPDAYQPNDSRKAIANPRPTRAEAGLPAQGFVFCCFNSLHKITLAIFGRWMRLLRGTEGAVLWLLNPKGGLADRLQREAAACGVDPARLVLAPRLRLADHLARLSLADLALDTLPYGAHTTASDALWAGVPMVTCLGASFAGRVGASLLSAVGLPELITRDLDSYQALALRLAHEPELLAGIRARLAANRLTQPLFDCARFARHLETAYETMWAIHCEGGEPRSFGVLPQIS